MIVDVGPELNLDGTKRIGDFVRNSPEGGSLDDFIAKAMEFNPRRDPILPRRSLLHNLRQQPNGKWNWKWDPGRMRDGAARIEDHIAGMRRLWSEVEKIDCPTLVMRGAKSDVFSDANGKISATPCPTGAGRGSGTLDTRCRATILARGARAVSFSAKSPTERGAKTSRHLRPERSRPQPCAGRTLNGS